MLISALSYSVTLTPNLFIITKSTRKNIYILACFLSETIIQTCTLKVRQYNFFSFCGQFHNFLNNNVLRHALVFTHTRHLQECSEQGVAM